MAEILTVLNRQITIIRIIALFNGKYVSQRKIKDSVARNKKEGAFS